MQGRVKQLRLHFGLDARTLADLLEVDPALVEEWETGTVPPSPADLALFEARFGVSVAWLAGEDTSIWGARLDTLRRQVAQQVEGISGPRLVQLISATTGERIAYVVNLMLRMAPDLCTVESMACWLGLSPGSTRLLLRGELDPGSSVVLRTSDLTGIPERWFRVGPVDQLAQADETGDLG
ncbi:MAG TPA: helix-turn-helix transcriptional regulator [Symbiobacteriaceae bacterium]|jgi:transcriptional regulator with XRE-family HTH domain|nr:helix-turn-helix transcriptional regulator [Symbiobacteriaceae bacterium]